MDSLPLLSTLAGAAIGTATAVIADRNTGHTLSTRSGATLRDTMARAGQSSEKAALIYQHSDEEQQRDVAAGLDDMVRAERTKQKPGEMQPVVS